MELKIYNPSEGGFLKEIDWNFDELKTELTAKAAEYRTIVYTSDEQIKKEAKADRAKLRKLIDAMDGERKRIKKQCMEPVALFEAQVKELTGIVDEAVRNIDTQVREYEERKRAEKLEKAKQIYEETFPEGIRDFVPFEAAMDNKYLLSGTSLKAVREGMQALSCRVHSDMDVINGLPEYAFEATERYRQTLDLQAAMRAVNDLRETAERRRIFEEQRKQQEEAYRQKQAREAEALINANRGFAPASAPQETENKDEAVPVPEAASRQAGPEPVYAVGLTVHGTRSQLDAFCRFLIDNSIRYDVTQKPREE